MKIENGDLIVKIDGKNVTQALPDVIGTSNVRAWQVPKAYKNNKLFVSVTQPGQAEEIPACSGKDAVFLGELELEPSPAQILAAAKAAKLEEINRACENFGYEIIKNYPEIETKTWPQQASEAAELESNPAASTPLLSIIAASRGLTVEDLAVKVRAKETAFKQAAGVLLGHRQALEDEIDLAADIDGLADIVFNQQILEI